MLTAEDIERYQKINALYGNAKSGQGRTRRKAGPIPEESRITPRPKVDASVAGSAFRSVPAMSVLRKPK